MEVVVALIIVFGIISYYIPIARTPQNEVACYAGGGSSAVKIRQDLSPILESKYSQVVKQRFDYSCGSAALSTLLRYYLGENLTEEEVIKGLITYGDPKLIEQRRAFSLLDMKRLVEALGYTGNGYKAEISDLKTLNGPCIIPINVYQYIHFVVFKGIYGDHIFFADPFQGNSSYTLKKFSEIWHQNTIFVVYPKKGDLVLNALKLKESDLLIIDSYIQNAFFKQPIPSSLSFERQQLFESTGQYQYYHER